jgi:heat shock protein HslJ
MGQPGCRLSSVPGEAVAVVLFALAPLLLVPSAVAGAATPTAMTSGIPPVIWELVRFSEPDRAPVTIADPSRYTVQFLPAGRLLVRLDCNPGSGGYTAAAGVLTLTPLAVTTAICPQTRLTPPFSAC